MSSAEHGPEQSVKSEGLRQYAIVSAVVAVAALVLVAAAVVVVTLMSSPANEPLTDDDAPVGWSLDPGAVVTVVAATPVKVIDGDTATFRLENGRVEKVRMIGIDAPEAVAVSDRYIAGAKGHVSQILDENPRVFLEKGVKERDRFGQLLAYVWLSRPSEHPNASEVRDKMLNARMLLDGFARRYPAQAGVTYENVRYSEVLKVCSAEAQARGRGFWNPSFLTGSGFGESPRAEDPAMTTPVTAP